jgi:uncharacterized membrane protein
LARKQRKSRSQPPRQQKPVQSTPAQRASQQMQAITMEYQGVLPTPAMFQGFENVVPGAADRILVMAETEAAHRHAMDKLFATYRFVGLAAGAGMAIGGLLVCGYLVKRGATGWAVAAFLAEVATLAAVFVLGRLVRSTNGS